MHLRQLEVFVGVYQVGSFNQAAGKLNATQSGLSMQIKNLEDELGTLLFERTGKGVKPTFAGTRLYATALEVLRQLDSVKKDLKTLANTVAGPLHVGLMPTFTRGVLAPVLTRFLADFPRVEVSVFEAYSAILIEKVAEEQLDFAIVPQSKMPEGIRSRYLGSDREILIRRPGGSPAHLAPVRLSELPPLKLALPARGNARRDRLEAYFASSGLVVEAIVDLDAMIATLEFVAESDFASILPATICGKDIDGAARWLNPIIDPPLSVGYAVVEPAAKAPSKAADIFLKRIGDAYSQSSVAWQDILSRVGAA